MMSRCCPKTLLSKHFYLFRGLKVPSFVLGLVFSRSFAQVVAIANLVSYFTDFMQEKLPKAASTVNLRITLTATLTICASIVSDVYIGRYQTLIYSTIIYIAGLLVLAFAASSPRSETVRLALILISFGQAGQSPALKAFLADQFQSSKKEESDNTKHEKDTKEDDQFQSSKKESDNTKHKQDTKDVKHEKQVNFWWNMAAFSGTVAGIILLAIVEGKQNWVLRYRISAITMIIAFCLFISGTPFYNYVEPEGSVLPRVKRVLVAAWLKRNLEFPPGANQTHQTDGLRFLDKAILEPVPNEVNEWTHCTEAEVEETKLLIRMLPMWTTFLLYGLVKSLGKTFFMQQGSNMNRKLGHIKVPLPVLPMFTSFTRFIIISLIYNVCKKFPHFKDILDPKLRIGIGMLFCVFCCSTAVSEEGKRLSVVKQYGFEDRPKDTLPISVFWLIPQFWLLGAMDGFLYPGMRRFFYDQVPKSMKNFGTTFTQSAVGLGTLLGVIIIAAESSWFADTINRSHLDYFYQTLTVLSYINLIYFAYVATKYEYKKADQEDQSDAHFDDQI